ncbi:MAG: ImmA/IrrE family metallo-endopeptidase [Planctomycetes bacterium]|nr:ImmA/IrrE family metallo-endopeptidase [Planctomycetota bacterium]
MPEEVSSVNPSILRWARECLGLSVDDVAAKLGRDTDEVEAWERGSSAPTYAQLEKLAYSIYKRPLAVFFLPEKPKEPSVRKEFRTLPEFDLDHLQADTRYQIRIAKAFQVSLKELNSGVNAIKEPIFREISLSKNKELDRQANRVRKNLRVSLSAQQSWPDERQAFKEWRNAIEDRGIYVFKQSFKQKEISGFCLPDLEFPIIYLNNSTTQTRQIFSLFHELGHLLLDVRGISKFDPAYINDLPPAERETEQFCNAFAAEVLMPSADFDAQIRDVDQFEEKAVVRLAKRYHVSREAVLRRLLDKELVDQDFYETKAKEWREQIAVGSGGNYYANQATYLGEKYVNLVLGKHYEGKLSLEQAADHLGLKTANVAGLEAMALRKVSE